MGEQEELDKAVARNRGLVDEARAGARSIRDSLATAIDSQLAIEYPRFARKVVESDFETTERLGDNGLRSLRATISSIDIGARVRSALAGPELLVNIDDPERVWAYEIKTYGVATRTTLPTQLQQVWRTCLEPLRSALGRAGYRRVMQMPELSPTADVAEAAELYVTANNRLVESWSSYNKADADARMYRASSAWDRGG